MSESELTGRVFGNYVLGDLIEEGGVGNVFAGQHRFLGDKVAIKLLRKHPSPARTKEIAKRFFQEAKATRSIDHPNVVRILDFGQDESDGMLYLVMEFLAGESLARALDRKGKLAEGEAAFIGASVARGLHAAHAQGIIHRDLKPGNIFLCSSGEVKLLDFGLAKVAQETSTLTATGVVVGTPQYMSPEQIQHGEIGSWTDVYGLGVVLFRMLTGRLPFITEDFRELIEAHVATAPPPPSQFAPVSAEMDAIALACLAKDPAKRASLPELRTRLDALAKKPEPAA